LSIRKHQSRGETKQNIIKKTPQINGSLENNKKGHCPGEEIGVQKGEENVKERSTNIQKRLLMVQKNRNVRKNPKRTNTRREKKTQSGDRCWELALRQSVNSKGAVRKNQQSPKKERRGVFTKKKRKRKPRPQENNKVQMGDLLLDFLKEKLDIP